MNNANAHLKSFIDNLDTKMWITRGCRYNSDRRLKKKNTLSLTAISFLSFYVLIISTLPLIAGSHINKVQNDILSTIAIVFSLFILILSLLETSKEYSIKAERLYFCANKINELMSQLKIVQSILTDTKELEESVKSINESYHSLISSYEENHDDLDLVKFKIDNRKITVKTKDGKKEIIGDFDIGLIDRINFRIQYFSHLSLYYMCIFVPPFVLILYAIYFITI